MNLVNHAQEGELQELFTSASSSLSQQSQTSNSSMFETVASKIEVHNWQLNNKILKKVKAKKKNLNFALMSERRKEASRRGSRELDGRVKKSGSLGSPLSISAAGYKFTGNGSLSSRYACCFQIKLLLNMLPCSFSSSSLNLPCSERILRRED